MSPGASTIGMRALARSEDERRLVLPEGLMNRVGQKGENGKMHVLAIGEFVLHDSVCCCGA